MWWIRFVEHNFILFYILNFDIWGLGSEIRFRLFYVDISIAAFLTTAEKFYPDFILISCPRHHSILFLNLRMRSLLMATTVPSFPRPLSWSREDNRGGFLVDKKHIQALPHSTSHLSPTYTAYNWQGSLCLCLGCACWRLSSLSLVPDICTHASQLLSVKRPAGVPCGQPGAW